ncbi:2-oxo-4-hydroxy-4-carboxy-5-ureidoimidazoline decarboxylase [Streptomyces sp. NPDC093225]|uniref:2-oxo-4-hydroxy-4-carboxy-5-ureidoimidazoline decarboxylase n=1 Tax=Streptomyces sp. NPDC093225 TaxID=3366034 RepID=UPI0037F78852
MSSHLPGQVRGSSGLTLFNAATPDAAEDALLHCCGSRRWAHRVAAHRPYPDLDALLAAADEAAYDLSRADLTEALADEFPAELHRDALPAAHLALAAAQDEYERTFGYAFLICLDDHPAEEHPDQVLEALHRRMANDPEEERTIAAEELRRLARGRLLALVGALVGAGVLMASAASAPGPPTGVGVRPNWAGSDLSDSPSVPV